MATFNRYNSIPETLPDKEFALVKEGNGFRWYVGNADNEPVPHTGGGNNTETDPTVPQHVKDITEQDIDNWNNPPSGDGYDSTVPIIVDTNTHISSPGGLETGNDVLIRGIQGDNHQFLRLLDGNGVNSMGGFIGVLFDGVTTEIFRATGSELKWMGHNVFHANNLQAGTSNVTIRNEDGKYYVDVEAGSSGSISNITEIPNRSYNDLQDKPILDYEPSFTKNSAFNKSFGDGSDDVARGDKTPPIQVVSQAEYDALGDVSNDPTIYMIKDEV